MIPDRPRAYLSWSSGKDSAYALIEARRQGAVDVVGVLTTVTEPFDRVSMHGVRRRVLDAQVAALGLPCIEVPLPYPCPDAVYEARMAEAVARIQGQGVRTMVFGDLFLEDIRAYREDRLKAVGMDAVFPLWGRDTADLARRMIADGLVAHLACVDPKQLAPEFAGRRFDPALLAALPDGVDPCGENGEFHTVVSAGPMFSRPLDVRPGDVVTRDGFTFADFDLAAPV